MMILNEHPSTRSVIPAVIPAKAGTGISVSTRNNDMWIFFLILVAVFLSSCSRSKDPVSDLLSQMTLDEKCGQLSCPIGFNFYGKEGDSVWLDESFIKVMDTMPLGSCYAVLRADPWTQKTLETGLHPAQSANVLNMMQRHAVENTRLGIPLLFCEEAPHGHMAIGTTVFPAGIAQASTWNPELLEKMGEVMGEEIRLQGAQVGYGPVLDIVRDPRFSRVEETMGEDPYLAGTLGTAVVKGMQKNVVSTLKHLAAYGIPQGGHNGASAEVGQNHLMSEYLPAFEMAIRQGGAQSVMTSYNAIDGVPCTSNVWLMQEVLRKSWNFNGVVFSDLFSINALFATHHVAADPAEAAALALKAGVDIDLSGYSYGGFLKEALQRGLIAEEDIDRAVRRVLQLKCDLGLFEHPYVDETLAEQKVGSAENAKLAKQVALESAVLLKNDGILPFDENIKKVAVIGPNADNMYNQLGDYTAPQDPNRVVTMLEGIQDFGFHKCLSSQSDAGCFYVTYAKGCSIRDEKDADLDAALKTAQSADAVVLVVGGSSARDFKAGFKAPNTVTSDEHVSDMECGEGYDRCTLDLLGKQTELMERVFATGKPTVVVYIEGRPLNKNLAAEKANALLTLWYPGMEGGSALADILWGDYNPSGRLPISIPCNVGQIPVHYSQPACSDYVEGTSRPLFTFGYGLSYTQFEYSDLQVVENMNNADSLFVVSCSVKNVGDYDGDEVVQLYVRDEMASVVQPSKLLKGFRKVHINKGETVSVSFVLSERDLSVYSSEKGWHFEPGEFSFMVGNLSEKAASTAMAK